MYLTLQVLLVPVCEHKDLCDSPIPLALKNLSGASSLGKTCSSSLGSHLFLVALHVGLGFVRFPSEISFICLVKSAGIVTVLVFFR